LRGLREEETKLIMEEILLEEMLGTLETVGEVGSQVMISRMEVTDEWTSAGG